MGDKHFILGMSAVPSITMAFQAASQSCEDGKSASVGSKSPVQALCATVEDGPAKAIGPKRVVTISADTGGLYSEDRPVCLHEASNNGTVQPIPARCTTLQLWPTSWDEQCHCCTVQLVPAGIKNCETGLDQSSDTCSI